MTTKQMWRRPCLTCVSVRGSTCVSMVGEDGLLLVMSTSTRRVEAVQVLPARGRSVAFRSVTRELTC